MDMKTKNALFLIIILFPLLPFTLQIIIVPSLSNIVSALELVLQKMISINTVNRWDSSIYSVRFKFLKT